MVVEHAVSRAPERIRRVSIRTRARRDQAITEIACSRRHSGGAPAFATRLGVAAIRLASLILLIGCLGVDAFAELG